MIYISEFHGCAYRLVRDLDSDGDWLEMTPLTTNNTFSLNDEDWTEVDEMAMLGEEECHREEVSYAYKTLKEG